MSIPFSLVIFLTICLPTDLCKSVYSIFLPIRVFITILFYQYCISMSIVNVVCVLLCFFLSVCIVVLLSVCIIVCVCALLCFSLFVCVVVLLSFSLFLFVCVLLCVLLDVSLLCACVFSRAATTLIKNFCLSLYCLKYLTLLN